MSKKHNGIPQVIIRVSVEDKEFIKKHGYSYAEIWRMGMQKFREKIPSELQKMVEKYQNLLLQCNNKLAECNNNVITQNQQIMAIIREYLDQGRPILRKDEKLDRFEKNWISAQLEKYNIPLEIEEFMERVRQTKNDESI